MKVILTIIALLVALASAIAGVTVALTVRTMHQRAEARREAYFSRAERLLPKYLVISARLDVDPFFAAPRPEADAGPFFNPRLRWDGVPGTDGRELALAESDQARVREWKEHWVEHADDPLVGSLDFTWMRGLSKYGRWNLVPGSPLEKLERRDLLKIPMPYFVDLITWSKLRLLRALKSGDYAAASAEVRQLAWLCYSSETLLGSMVALSILRAERTAHDAAERASADLQGWTAYDEAWLTAARHTLFAGLVYTNLALPDALQMRARAARAPRCAGLVEVTWVAQMRKDAGKPLPPWYEAEFAHPQPPCRLDFARWLAASSAKPLSAQDLQQIGAADRELSPAEVALLRFFPDASLELLEMAVLQDMALDNLDRIPE